MKKLFGKWNAFEIIWLIVFSVIALVITLITKDNLFGFIVFFAGILCVVLAAKGNILNYPVGIINSVGYGYIALQNGLFGEAGLNFIFYLPMNIIGFIFWYKHINNAVVKMRRMKNKTIAILILVSLIIIVLLGFGLSLISGQNTPYIDATTNVLSITATILMLRRFREQWMFYIILNVFTIIMWSIRANAGSPDGVIMIVMWSAYLINSCYGYYNWSKGSQADIEEAIRG